MEGRVAELVVTCRRNLSSCRSTLMNSLGSCDEGILLENGPVPGGYCYDYAHRRGDGSKTLTEWTENIVCM